MVTADLSFYTVHVPDKLGEYFLAAPEGHSAWYLSHILDCLAIEHL